MISDDIKQRLDSLESEVADAHTKIMDIQRDVHLIQEQLSTSHSYSQKILAMLELIKDSIIATPDTMRPGRFSRSRSRDMSDENKNQLRTQSKSPIRSANCTKSPKGTLIIKSLPSSANTTLRTKSPNVLSRTKSPNTTLRTKSPNITSRIKSPNTTLNGKQANGKQIKPGASSRITDDQIHQITSQLMNGKYSGSKNKRTL